MDVNDNVTAIVKIALANCVGNRALPPWNTNLLFLAILLVLHDDINCKE